MKTPSNPASGGTKQLWLNRCTRYMVFGPKGSGPLPSEYPMVVFYVLVLCVHSHVHTSVRLFADTDVHAHAHTHIHHNRDSRAYLQTLCALIVPSGRRWAVSNTVHSVSGLNRVR